MVAQITQNHWKLLVKKVPQGSVVTYLRYSGISNEDFITNILLRLKVKDSGNGSTFSEVIDKSGSGTVFHSVATAPPCMTEVPTKYLTSH